MESQPQPQPLPRDFWSTAMTPDAYVAQMTQNRDVFSRRISETDLTNHERSAFSSEPLRFLLLTEDFCGDSAQFLPPIVQLGQELDNVEVRVLLRDQHRDLANGYRRKDGYQAIPVIIALDSDGNELGYIVERPQRAAEALAAETRRFAKENPQLEGVNRAYANMPLETKALVLANSERFRDEQQATFTRWLFDELAGVVSAARQRAVVAD